MWTLPFPQLHFLSETGQYLRLCCLTPVSTHSVAGAGQIGIKVVGATTRHSCLHMRQPQAVVGAYFTYCLPGRQGV